MYRSQNVEAGCFRSKLFQVEILDMSEPGHELVSGMRYCDVSQHLDFSSAFHGKDLKFEKFKCKGGLLHTAA